MLSESLRIRVSESGSIKADLTFGADAVDNLVDLVPQEIHPKLAARSIQLDALVAQAQKSNYAPVKLFALEEGTKTVQVWLE